MHAELTQRRYRFRSPHHDGYLIERLQEFVLQADRLRSGDQESCSHTGQKDHYIEIARGSLPNELLEFLPIFNRPFLE